LLVYSLGFSVEAAANVKKIFEDSFLPFASCPLHLTLSSTQS
jgi:hypothetical protein